MDKKSTERGYFKPEAVRRLVYEHMEGADYAARLGALISLELRHRMFIDKGIG